MTNDPYTLQAYREGDLVGWLRYNPEEDVFRFDYAPDWKDKRHAFQLSPHIPFDGPAPAVTVRRFIQNLLPEGEALDVAAVYNQVSKSNDFGLLRALGGETAGALRFLAAPQPPQEPVRRRISFEELSQRIAERDRQPFIVWDGKVRISVAGYQDKLQVIREGNDIYLADGSLSSTHILKPPSRNPLLPHMVANEHFCMSLASALGSSKKHFEPWAAQVDILRVPDPVLCVTRFDRRLDGDVVRSFHILDGCQALDRPVSHKYERNIGSGEDVKHIRDGVSFEALAALRAGDHLANAAVDLRQMARWAITTLLIGNSDAHAKNLSFFAQYRSLAVAPFYDLVCTAVYDGNRVEQDLAMAFGDEFQLDAVRAFALADFCERLGYPRAAFARELRTACIHARRAADELAAHPIYVDDERAFVRQLADFIIARADALQGFAADIPKFAADNFADPQTA
ncbi:Serine/threonine-protein kinase HipA [compost metagenome]